MVTTQRQPHRRASTNAGKFLSRSFDPTETILDLLSSGMTTDEILADYEDLEPDDLRAVLAFAARLARTRRLQSVEP